MPVDSAAPHHRRAPKRATSAADATNGNGVVRIADQPLNRHNADARRALGLAYIDLGQSYLSKSGYRNGMARRLQKRALPPQPLLLGRSISAGSLHRTPPAVEVPAVTFLSSKSAQATVGQSTSTQPRLHRKQCFEPQQHDADIHESSSRPQSATPSRESARCSDGARPSSASRDSSGARLDRSGGRYGGGLSRAETAASIRAAANAGALEDARAEARLMAQAAAKVRLPPKLN